MSKRASVQYKYLNTEGLDPQFDLKSCLVDIMSRTQTGTSQKVHENAKFRIKDLGLDGSVVILNKLSEPSTWGGPVFSGQLIQLDRGREVAAVVQPLEDDTAEFTLGHLQLDEQTRILRGALYFAVTGNHVGIIEGQQVRSRTLEQYLSRTLQEADEFEPGQVIKLNSSFRTESGKRVSNPTEISIAPKRYQAAGGLPKLSAERPAGEGKGSGKTVLDVLEALGWDPAAINALRESVPAGGWLEGVFKVKLRLRGQRPTLSRTLIDEALRNVDPEDLGLKGDGNEKNGLMKLSSMVTVSARDQLLEPDDAIAKIVEVLKEWSAEGKIDCRF